MIVPTAPAPEGRHIVDKAGPVPGQAVSAAVE